MIKHVIARDFGGKIGHQYFGCRQETILEKSKADWFVFIRDPVIFFEDIHVAYAVMSILEHDNPGNRYRVLAVTGED